jgi:hypothetical protein
MGGGWWRRECVRGVGDEDTQTEQDRTTLVRNSPASKKRGTVLYGSRTAKREMEERDDERQHEAPPKSLN